MTPNSVRQACVIRCGADKSCPAGKKCTMIYDGPGEVCE
jgi:hypothetical protein